MAGWKKKRAFRDAVHTVMMQGMLPDLMEEADDAHGERQECTALTEGASEDAESCTANKGRT